MGKKTIKNYHDPKFEFSTIPRSLIFRKKWKLRLWRKLRWWPPRVHLGAIGSKKWVKTVKNYHAQKFEFSATSRSSIFHKKGSYGYGAKSWWGPSRVHLGANVVPLGPKKGSKPLKITMPLKSNFRLPRVQRFFTKNGSYGYGAKSRLGPPRVHLGPMRSHWVKKIGQKRK